jgi:AraC-like DNA-binding protein/ligand-binding sensor protein
MDVSLPNIFKPDVQSILDTFTALLDIRIALFSSLGEEVKVGSEKNWCTYCSQIREDLELEENCRSLDAEMMEKAKMRGEIVSYTCHGGMREAIIPLFMESNNIGYLMIGQFRNSKKLPENIASLWKRKIGDSDRGDTNIVDNRMDDAGIVEAYLQAPFYTPEKTERIFELFSLLSDYIMANHLVQARGGASMDILLSYMRRHLDEPFTLADAAAMLGRSISGTAALFKHKTGKSFKEVQGEMKMVKAVELIRERPRLQVQEIAQRLGFSDPLYFSRFFKKNTGISPILFQKGYF